ncbi:MAG: haloacid dehalogenase type II [Gemmatimonadetes bacterium]|nr:haloacid dehalogenase type II [Gemmatimonadota bacterium]MXY81640.1 haloacid dehalogenase type II [Gemmatimonadota bacterium]MYB67423.1 haloacid dehalogenase type II [Gemmatimonadota bacterium]
MESWQTSIKALTVDVFGTVTDWHSTIVREGERLGSDKRLTVDWAHFATAWRGGYEPAMGRVRRGELPWTKIDALHRMILDDILQDFSIPELSEDERSHFNRVWHRLDPWPDVVGGMLRLKSKYIVAALSNGNMSLLTNMAKHAGIPWDCILSAELARHYKPDREVYETAAQLLDLEPPSILMVAAHRHDLAGARAVGFRTAFIPRPLEWGPDGQADTGQDGDFDIIAQDFHDLATQLGS